MRAFLITGLFCATAVLFAGCIGADGADASSDSEEGNLTSGADAIRVLYADPSSAGRVVLQVENLAYDKDVRVFNSPSASANPWPSVAASYRRAAASSSELWTADLPTTGILFAARYRANHAEYWDNNNSHDYSMSSDTGPVLGATINALVIRSEVGGDGAQVALTGRVLVRNLAPNKSVKVVYSTDGWASSNTTQARYAAGYAQGTEAWEFAVPISQHATSLTFAAAATMQGHDYWDNAFGKNFQCAKKSNGYWMCEGGVLGL